MNATTSPAVEVIEVAKHYGAVQALKPTSFKIDAGTYYVLLGPSGGGKTTTLRLIGGLVRPSQGRVFINGEDVTRTPPNKRNTSMVFQNYALFPHMNVEQNVGYGLRLRKLPASAIKQQVDAMLELVGLSGYQARLPHALSGGQQQRVQLARSLVLQTDILLLDEPLAALDAKLRKTMCYELKRIQEQVGITFVHVTHNQEEAMTIADRIAIIADGELVEEAGVRDIYERPQRRFTADFIGENTVLEGRITALNGELATLDLGFASVQAKTAGQVMTLGQAAALSIRPEVASITASNDQSAKLQSLPATFVEQAYLGYTTTTMVRLANAQEGLTRMMSGASMASFVSGQDVRFAWSLEDARLHSD